MSTESQNATTLERAGTDVDDGGTQALDILMWSRPRYVLTVALLAILAAVTTWTAWVATSSLFITGVAAALLAASGIVTGVRWWRDRDGDLADYVFDGAVIGVGVGAAVNGHWGWAVVTLLSNAAVCGIANMNPARIVDRVLYSWWTPWGAEGKATAVAAWDAAHRLRELQEHPRYQDATVDELVDAFAEDRRLTAAGAINEPCYEARDPRRDDGVCFTCAGAATGEPCAEHTPRLYEAYLEDQSARRR